jgi:hypothetical protein
MVCAAAHAAAPGVSRQMVSLVRWTVRASQPPAGPGASVAAPGGRLGSSCQEPVELVMVSARPLLNTMAAPLGPSDAERRVAPWSGSGWDRCQCSPAVGPGRYQAGRRPGAGRQHRGGGATGGGESEHGDVLPGVRGGQRWPGGVPGPVAVGEDAGASWAGAARCQQGNSRHAERRGGEPAGPALAPCCGRAKGPAGGQPDPARSARSGELGAAVGEQREQTGAGAGGGQGIGDIRQCRIQQVRCPGSAVVASRGERGVGQPLARPESRYQRPGPGAGDH